MFKKSFLGLVVGFSLLSHTAAVFAAGSWDFDWVECDSNRASTLSISEITGEEFERELTSVSEPVSPRRTLTISPESGESVRALSMMEEDVKETSSSLDLSSSSTLSMASQDQEQNFGGFEPFPFVAPPTYARSEGDSSWSSEPTSLTDFPWWDTQTYPAPSNWFNQ